jgi:hypothetical protein
MSITSCKGGRDLNTTLVRRNMKINTLQIIGVSKVRGDLLG